MSARRVLVACSVMLGCTSEAALPEESPTLRYLEPSFVLRGRDADVTIVVGDAELDDSTQFNLGSDVEVTATRFISATTAVVSIRTTDEAALGMRDVVVTVDAQPLLLAGAFSVKPAMDVTTVSELGGRNAQGRIGVLDAVNNDPDNDFECGASAGVIFPQPKFVFATPYAFSMGAIAWACTPNHLRGLMMWAPSAPSRVRIDGHNGHRFENIYNFDGVDVSVEADQPSLLVDGEARTERLREELATGYFRWQIPADTEVAIARVFVEGTTSQPPALLAFRADSTFERTLSSPLQYQSKIGLFYPVLPDRNRDTSFIYYNGNLAGGDDPEFDYHLHPRLFTATLADENEPNGHFEQAQRIGEHVILTGTLTDADDVDYVAIGLPEGVRVQVVVDSDAVVDVAQVGELPSFNLVKYIVQSRLGALAPGVTDYVVTVRARPGFPMSSPASYSLFFVREEEASQP